MKINDFNERYTPYELAEMESKDDMFTCEMDYWPDEELLIVANECDNLGRATDDALIAQQIYCERHGVQWAE